jgi:hypothetical protein
MWFTHNNNIVRGLVGGDNNIFVSCFGILTKDEELDLPSLYWISKLHKRPYKQRYIAGSAKCSTKPHSKLLTCIVYVMWFTQKNNIVRGFVGGDNNIFVMEEKQVFSNIWGFKDWCRASAHRPIEVFFLHQRPHTPQPFEKVSKSMD